MNAALMRPDKFEKLPGRPRKTHIAFATTVLSITQKVLNHIVKNNIILNQMMAELIANIVIKRAESTVVLRVERERMLHCLGLRTNYERPRGHIQCARASIKQNTRVGRGSPFAAAT